MNTDSLGFPTLHPLESFCRTPLDDLLPSAADNGVDSVLKLFRRTVSSVPAYRDFLASRGALSQGVETLDDFRQLPLMTRTDYMQAYPLVSRCEGGSFASCDRIAVSSGSTGTPGFWPRSWRHELGIAVRFEQVFRDSFRAHERSTLAIVCFALGNWVGGLFTTSCCWHLSYKGYPLMVATPGNNTNEIFRIIRELSSQFDQTVLLGYPPFIKDVIDAGTAEGLDWPSCNIRLVFAGEVFSEEWRTEIVRRMGSSYPVCDTASLYGTADGGVLGNETAYTIAVRRFLADHPDAARALFGESRLPTLVQYDPCSRFFEVHDNTLVVSGDSGVPLVRYHIADKGGLIGFQEIQQFLRDHGAETWMDQSLRAATVRPLPMVYVFGRADFTVSFYGANIYPENVSVALEQPNVIEWITGKFVLQVLEKGDGNKTLIVAIELCPDVVADPVKTECLSLAVQEQLLRINSEFRHYTPPERQRPDIVLRPFGDPEYFPLGVKHRYTRC